MRSRRPYFHDALRADMSRLSRRDWSIFASAIEAEIAAQHSTDDKLELCALLLRECAGEKRVFVAGFMQADITQIVASALQRLTRRLRGFEDHQGEGGPKIELTTENVRFISRVPKDDET